MSSGEDPLFFTVIGAKGLDPATELGTYITVSVGTQMLFHTRSEIGESPQWNETHPINVSGPRSYSIAVHRESPTADCLLGEIANIIVDSSLPELTLPIESRTGGKPIIVTVSIRRLEDMLILGDTLNNHSKRLVCLSDFIIKSLSDRHPDLPRSARLSVAIVVNGNSLYETTPLKKEPAESHWNCNGKVVLSSSITYALQVINETASKKRLGFIQLDHDFLEKPQEKRVRRNMVKYTKDDPWLEILFTATFLGHCISDTLPQSGGNIACTNSGIHQAGLPLNNALESYGDRAALMSSAQASSSHSGSAYGRSKHDDVLSSQITGSLSVEQKAMYLNGLGNTFQSQYERIGDSSDLEKAIFAQETAVQLTPTDHPSKAFYLNNLGGSYKLQFERLGEIPILEKAIYAQENAVALTPTSHPNAAGYLYNLGNAFWSRYERLGDSSDLEKAISANEKAVGLTPTGHPNAAAYLNGLGNTFQSRYERLGDSSDLEKAISALENAVELTPTGHPNTVMYLHSLASSYLSQFKRLGEISVLEKAISTLENAVELIPTGHPSKTAYLNNLGNSYILQFERLGEISDLEMGISALENAVELTPTGHPNKAIYLNNLGSSYKLQFERLGEIPILEKAIYAQENAVQLTPTGHPNKAHYLSILGCLYHSQFKRLGEISVLEKAISTLENAVQLTPTGHPNTVMYLHSLASSYLSQFERLGQISVLEKAISTQENVIELTMDYMDKPMQYNNLGVSYQLRFDRLGEISDLEKAILAFENAVELAPTGHPNKAMYLDNLGCSYQSQFDTLREISALEKAISIREKAVELTPTGHPSNVTLKEEAVHLAAGMLMAGYRSVIATMWAIMDEDGPLVADDVYAELLRNGQPDYTRAAYALHHAAQNLRRRGAPFRSWVPFIHLGR